MTIITTYIFFSSESWHGLLADTSQSSFGSTSSPPLLLDDKNLRIGSRSLEHQGYYNQPYHSFYQDRKNRRQIFLNEASPISSSLPSYYERRTFQRIKPEFRKSSSQPTRSLSPSFRSPSPSIGDVVFSKPIPSSPTASSMFLLKKRQLPQVPTLRKASRDKDQLSFHVSNKSKSWKPQAFQARKSTDTLAPLAMYSDSEINTRPVCDRIMYAHPHRVAATHHARGRGRRQPDINSLHNSESHSVSRCENKASSIMQRDSSSANQTEPKYCKERLTCKSPKIIEGEESGDESETSSVSKLSAASSYSNISERPRETSRTRR